MVGVGLEWQPWSLPEFLAGLLMWVAAGVVYMARPRASQNRRLALVLGVHGWTFVGRGMLMASRTPISSEAWVSVSIVSFAAVQVLYLYFLATIRAPSVAWLRSRFAQVVLIGAALAASALALGYRDMFWAPVARNWTGAWFPGFGPWIIPLFQASAVVSVFGLIVALDAFRVTKPETMARKRALGFVVAFGVRDGLLALRMFVFQPMAAVTGADAWLALAQLAPPISEILFVLVLGYAILKSQVLEIDLKLRFAVEKSTIAATFGVVFLVASEAAESLLPVEGAFVGLAAAVAIGLAFRRIEAGAHRFAGHVFPAVEDSEAYRDKRAVELYQGALEDVMRDGEITQAKRAVLDGLCERLSLPPDTARSIEERHRVTSP